MLLDEPLLSVGYMGNIIPFQVQKGDPSSGRTITIGQDLPFPGKRSLRGKVASSDADAEWWAFEQTRRNVVAEVKDAYFDLYYLTRAIGVVTKTKILLEQFTQIAEVRYSVGKGIQQDVLKAQVEFSGAGGRGRERDCQSGRRQNARHRNGCVVNRGCT